MVLDINTTPLSSNHADLVAIGSTTYFSADDGIHGQELWKSDGTAAGSIMVTDINPGGGSSDPSHLTDVNGTLFFAADDGTHGFELWKSDGGAAGTIMVADINAGGGDSYPIHLTNVNGTLFFSATDSTHGTELWKSDGTAAGTVLVKDIRSGGHGSDLSGLTNVNGTLFFSAYDDATGRELWKSDGTAAGTTLVKDIYPGAHTGYYGGLRPSNSYPGNLTNVNGTLFFAADDGTDGVELWKSDGTAAGTTLVKDLYPGSYHYDGYSYSNSSDPKHLTTVDGTLFFAANDGTDGVELWKSDGTAAGTTLVKDLYPGSYTDYYGGSYLYSSDPKYLTNVGGTLFFAANDGTHGFELWKSDGTADGTVVVAALNPSNLTNANGTLFFTADDGTHGDELWQSDGTAAGTVLVADINPGTSGSFPSNLTNANGTLFFVADDGSHGTKLWQSDGSAAGTVMVQDNAGNASSSPSNLTNVNGTLYFAANNGTHDAELWKSDGTAAGTTLVKDLYPGGSGSSPSNLTNVDGTLFFLAQGRLWKSDGTADGTINLGGGDAPAQLTGANGTLFFLSSDSTYGIELWKSDGTAAGTTLLKDIFPGGYNQYYYGYYGGRYSRYIPNSSNPHNFTDVNGTLFFTANDGNGAELWKSDGTAAGTVMVADINPGSGGSYPAQLTDVNGTLYFAANDGTDGTELWKSDGTAAGTVMVADINPGSGGSDLHYLTNVIGTLFFAADDGTHGVELWKSDGTALGTVVVTALDPSNLTNVNGTLFFTADDGTHGDELWKSDGSAAGAVMVAGINPDSNSSSPSDLTNLNGTLFFAADDGAHGTELWQSDGTAPGTVMVADINPGSTGSYPSGLTNAGGTLYFAAVDGVHGNELWELSTTLPTLVVSGFSTSTTAGAPGSFTVRADNADGSTDTSYTGTVHFTSSDGQAELPSDYTFTPADAGVHTFSATLKTAGTQSLTVTNTASAGETGIQSGITVLPGAASQITLSTPAGSTAGTPFSITVTARDPYNNPAAGYTGTVHFTSSDGQASLPGDYTFLPADAGAHTFTAGVTLKTAGSQTVTVSDGAHSASEADIAVTPAAVSQLVVTAPLTSTAGSPFSITVTARDAYDNTAVYAGTVHFQSSDGQASLPAEYSFRPNDAGVHTFTNGVTLEKAGSQTVAASDGSITAGAAVLVSPAAASMLIVSGFPSLTTAGVAGNLTVTLEDPYGNIATGYAGTVRFSSSDRQANLPGAYTFLPADAGAHTFTAGVTLKTAGSQTVTASDGSTIGSEADIEVTPAAASQLVVTAPVTTTAGGTFSITVTARDAYNNIVPNYAGRIRFSSIDGQAGLPADYTFLPAHAGAHTFTGGVLLKTAGGQTVTASDGAITGRAAVVVSPAAASKLIVSGFPSPTTAGANDSFTVAVEDPYGNIATSFDGTVQFQSSDGHASLPAGYTFLPADAGVHTFTSGVALETAGSQTVTASAGSITGSAAVVVSPAAASKVILSGFPSRKTARVAGGVTVTVQDPYGNIATGYAGTVHFSSSDPKARIVDPSTGRLIKLGRFRYAFKSTDRGVHKFSVTLKTPGRHSITVMAGTTASLTVKDARPSRRTQRR